MSNIIQARASDFTCSAVMEDGRLEENFNLHQYMGKSRCMILFYPLNFTFVCPSELIHLNNLVDEFAKRNTKVLGISVDSLYSHVAYREYLQNHAKCSLKYPLVSDIKKDVSRAYNVLHEKDGVALRGSFIIDESKNIRHITMNDFPIGRNIEEGIRIIDAIDHNNKHGEVCPANWRTGESGMHATVNGVKSFLEKNYK